MISGMRGRRLARAGRTLLWLVTGALVVLSCHVLAYALEPRASLVGSELVVRGGPRLLVIAAGGLAVFGLVSVGVVWAAWLGVRERLLLEERPVVNPPRLRLLRFGARAVLLWVATSLVFAYFESYLHWRAGLGWHGIQCLVGPVHRDAVPLLAGLSVLAAALVCASEHVVAWARRVFAARRAGRPPRSVARTTRRRPASVRLARPSSLSLGWSQRGPPVPSV
jgi:membrane protease YdiL (CAAX protease family)